MGPGNRRERLGGEMVVLMGTYICSLLASQGGVSAARLLIREPPTHGPLWPHARNRLTKSFSSRRAHPHKQLGLAGTLQRVIVNIQSREGVQSGGVMDM